MPFNISISTSLMFCTLKYKTYHKIMAKKFTSQFFVICENYPDIHHLTYHYICQADTQKDTDFIIKTVERNKQMGILDYYQFNTLKEADSFFDNYQLSKTKKYTKHIIENGIPLLLPKKCRVIFAFMNQNLVPNPGYFRINIEDFKTLRSKYENDIKLPSLVELEELKEYCEISYFHESILEGSPDLFVNDIATIFEDWL